MRKLSELFRFFPLKAAGLAFLSVGVAVAFLLAGALWPSDSRKTAHAAPEEETVAFLDDSAGISLSIESRATEVGEEKAETEKKRAEKKASLDLVVQGEEPKPADRDLARADSMLEVKDWKGASALYEKVLRRQPKNDLALKGKVFALELGATEEALDVLEDLSVRYPRAAFVFAARARVLVKQNDMLEALKAWERAVKLEPGNKDYKLGLAVLNDRLGREAEALKLYREIPGALPADAQKRVKYLAKHAASAE